MNSSGSILFCCVLFQVHYTSENVVEGKSAAKKALQQMLGLQQTDTPVVGIITRLTVQKGIHLIKHAMHRALERNGQVLSFSCSGIASLLCFIYTMFRFLRTDACVSMVGGFTGFCTRSSHTK
jgi:glycogen synthase